MPTVLAGRMTLRPMQQVKVESLYIRFPHTTAREECAENGCRQFLTMGAKSFRSKILQTFLGIHTVTVWHTAIFRTMLWTGVFMNPLPA